MEVWDICSLPYSVIMGGLKRFMVVMVRCCQCEGGAFQGLVSPLEGPKHCLVYFSQMRTETHFHMLFVAT